MATTPTTNREILLYQGSISRFRMELLQNPYTALRGFPRNDLGRKNGGISTKNGIPGAAARFPCFPCGWVGGEGVPALYGGSVCLEPPRWALGVMCDPRGMFPGGRLNAAERKIGKFRGFQMSLRFS